MLALQHPEQDLLGRWLHQLGRGNESICPELPKEGTFHQRLNLSDTALPVSGCSQAWLYSVGAQLSDMPLLMPCPLQGAEKQQLCDFTRRRRWLRRRRESLAGSAPPTPSSARPAPSAQLQGNSSRRTTSLRCG